MRASIFISKFFILTFLLLSSSAWAASGTTKADKTLPPEEDDFTTTPYTQYGDFNQQDEEAEGIKFLQYGRLFGVSIGTGYSGVFGDRGALYQGGFPMIDVKLHYWFDFHFAFDLAFWTANHYYTAPTNSDGQSGTVTVNLYSLMFDIKYYIDTKDLTAPISFANPYFLVGAGSMNKSETANGTTASDTAFAVAAGMGLEFALKPRSAYFDLEAKFYSANFQDTNDGEYAPAYPDLTGIWYTITGSFLFTW